MFTIIRATPGRLKKWYRDHWYHIISTAFALLACLSVSAIAAFIVARVWDMSFMPLFLWLMLVTSAIFGYWKYRGWRKLHPRQPRSRKRQSVQPEEVPEPDYIPYEELHPITREFSGISRDELHTVYYDEPHHWIVTLAMVFNPFWGRDNDVQPDMSQALRAKLNSKADERLVKTLRHIIKLARWVHHAMLLLGALGLVVVLHRGDITWLPLWLPLLLIAVPIAATIPWVMYIRRIAQGCRLVMTKRQIRLVVHQLPWRSNDSTPIAQQVFNAAVVVQTLLGKLLGYVDAIIRTKEQEEPLPAWIRARNAKKLRDVLKYWEWEKYVRARVEHENRLIRNTAEVPDEQVAFVPSVADTQPIPVQSPSTH